MTENVNAPVIPSGSPAETVSPVQVPDLYAGMTDSTFETAQTFIAAANAIVARYRASLGTADLVSDWLNTSDDPKAITYRDWREATKAELEKAEKDMVAYASSKLPAADTFDMDAEKAQYDMLKKSAKDFSTLLSGFPGGKEKAKALPSLESLAKKGSSNTAEGGTKRPRFSRVRYVEGLSADDNTQWTVSEREMDDPKNEGAKRKVQNLSYLIQDLEKTAGKKVDSAMFREHVFAAAKDAAENGGDIKSLAGSPFTFQYSVPGTDKSFVIELTPVDSDE